MGKRLSEKNPFLKDPEKKRRLMLSAIAAFPSRLRVSRIDFRVDGN